MEGLEKCQTPNIIIYFNKYLLSDIVYGKTDFILRKH